MVLADMLYHQDNHVWPVTSNSSVIGYQGKLEVKGTYVQCTLILADMLYHQDKHVWPVTSNSSIIGYQGKLEVKGTYVQCTLIQNITSSI